jgi:CRP/FNR family cyclic AMP-dependent transcriptional regulator
MQLTDVIGCIASLLVLLTFCMRDMTSLRIVALLSNFAFLLYGISLHLAPIIALHGILIPINVFRLASLRDRRAAAPIAARPTPIAARPTPIAEAARAHGPSRPS